MQRKVDDEVATLAVAGKIAGACWCAPMWFISFAGALKCDSHPFAGAHECDSFPFAVASMGVLVLSASGKG